MRYLKSNIFFQVPSDFDVASSKSRFIGEEIPVFELIGSVHPIQPFEMYEIDSDARLVYNYLKAYRSGFINTLFIPG